MTAPDADVLSDLLNYLDASPTPFHAVTSATARLLAEGFTLVSMAEPWAPVRPGRYFTVHGETSVFAWVVPARGPSGGFRIVGAHTDSPNLRLKPRAEYRKEGYDQLAVEVYGGVLLNSWLDRDLSLAGRLLVRGDEGALGSRLVKISRPILRIPQLAIHLDRDVNDKGVQLNKQTHMPPVLGMTLAPAANGSQGIRALCATEAGIEDDRIVAMDLMLYDVSKAQVAGIRNDFIFSARLDNLAMCHAAITALIRAARQAAEGDVVPVAALFDHEEVGSESATGAASGFFPHLLERIVMSDETASVPARETFLRALSKSLCVSADMSHAVHPNYAEKHDAHHRPLPNGGPVIKVNAQQRYATSATTGALFAELCKEANVPVQYYSHRSDLPCGSTIGPIVSSRLGVRTVDVGNAMLSMHSIREMAGTRDPAYMVGALAKFYGTADLFAGT